MIQKNAPVKNPGREIPISAVFGNPAKENAEHFSLTQKTLACIHIQSLLIINITNRKTMLPFPVSIYMIPSSFIQTILSASESHRIGLAARGLYHRWGLSPRPEDFIFFTVFIIAHPAGIHKQYFSPFLSIFTERVISSAPS